MESLNERAETAEAENAKQKKWITKLESELTTERNRSKLLESEIRRAREAEESCEQGR